jgi:(2R)-3-sulfolactate dehydrogenase (NADP+)
MMQAAALSTSVIVDLALRALVRAGARVEAASSLARAIAAAEADGLASHGLAYLPTYCEHLRCGKVNGAAQPKLQEVAPSVLVVDAGSGFAHPAIDSGFEALIPLARRQGIAALAVRDSYNCGVLGYHTERLALSGLFAIGFTNAPASIAPVGSKRPVVGTNPWSVAAPDGAGEVALLIDQSASVIAKSEVMKRARQGTALPVGWALDADGQPTTDPEAALKGTMMPSGGYKGVGSALFVELMAACLAGATLGIHASPFSGTAGGPPRTGQFFIAIDPQASSGGAFFERLKALIGAFTGQPGAHLPGSHRKAARTNTAAKGIVIDAALYARVISLLGDEKRPVAG